jgi:8-oxo-dGTP diphosphatase
MKTRRVSAIIFFDSKNRILLQDRRGYKQLGEEYGFFGGEIKNRETPEQALIREVREELGYELKDYEFIGIFSGQIKDFKVIVHTFISKLKNISDFKQKEGIGMKLVDLKTAEKLLTWPWDKVAVKSLKKILVIE